MKKILLPLLLFFVSLNLIASPLHSKLKHSIIIDTDCNDNDLIAISILLSHPGITVKAIIITEGKRLPDEGTEKIRMLLQQFNADSIPLTVGYSDQSQLTFSEILHSAGDPITIVCLGPLTNTNILIRNNPELIQKIEEIIWYNEYASPLKGYNYINDKVSADNLFSSDIIINSISNLYDTTPVFDKRVFGNNNTADISIAESFVKVIKMIPDNQKYISEEELAALFLISPELFEMNIRDDKQNIRFNEKNNIPAIRELVADILSGKFTSGHFVAFKGFPVDKELYLYDVRQIMDKAIASYGIEEWKACVMTDEFHGHLGVYSIVGAKMGIYAREYFNIGTDLLEITSYAGSVTPFSCMNDGLQVSTGATLGQGTISLAEESVTRPQAIFRYQNKEIIIKLKNEYIQQLKAVIDEGVKNYGLQDEAYWTLVRQTSLKFWLEWDRKEIFELIEI